MLKLNDVVVTPTVFPDRTSQVWKLPNEVFQQSKANVEWRFENEAELFHLLQLVHLLNSKNIRVDLKFPYLPYARQDKSVSNDATFALETLFKVLRTFELNSVEIMDPHNPDAVRFSCKAKFLYPVSQVVEVAERMSSDLICYPDKGALNKYASQYHGILPFIYGEKVRDQATGNITSYQVVGDPSDKNVLIVDDICDGGMTFKILAKDLLAAGAKSVVLFVTHGIFSKGLQTLKDSGIQRIYTQDGEASEDEGSIMYRRLS